MTTDATRKLIQDLSVDILGKLSKVVVKDTSFQEKRTDDTKPLKKKDVVAGIVNEIEKTGVKSLSDSLKVADAQAICETLKVDFKDSSKNRKNVLSKRLKTLVVKDGLEEVLGELETEQQTACLEALKMKDKSGTSKAIAQRLAAEVRKIGAEIILSKMDMVFLKELADHEGVDVYDVTSQTVVIEAILTGKVPAKRARVEPKKEPISKKKPKLESGITVANMMQHYNLSELQDFARDNGLVISGKKKEVMKRIHEFFEGEEEPASKKVKSDSKKETKKEDKKETKKETKKATKKEEKEEKEDEEEEEEAEEKEEKEKSPKSPKKTPKSPKKETKKAAKKEEKEAEEKEEVEEKEEKEKSPKSPKKAKGKGKKEVKETGER